MTGTLLGDKIAVKGKGGTAVNGPKMAQDRVDTPSCPGVYAHVWEQIGTLLKERPRVLAAIDGRCGSGKSGLAARIEERFAGTVLHMDDFYLPIDRRQPDWMRIPGGNMDLERFRREVLEPAYAGEPILYRPYDCREGRMGDTARLPASRFILVEGSYSQHPLLADLYDYKLFLTCSQTAQEKRLRRREGERFDGFQKRWIPMEERYFTRCKIPESCDEIVDTTSAW